MAGHSKWANIKHRKAAQDAKRGKAFTRLIRELVVASRQGGSSVEDNSRLRAAVDKALGANMTRDTIDRAISRGSGNSDSENLDEMTYEVMYCENDSFLANGKTMKFLYSIYFLKTSIVNGGILWVGFYGIGYAV